MSSPGSDPAPVRVERPAPGVVVATLDRPDAGNALDVAMVQALEDLADAVRADVDVRVLVIGASGSAFSLGYDVAESADRTDATVPDDLDRQERTADALAAIRALRVPVVAAVGGPAAGTGLALALVADIRLAGPDAVFQASFTALGTSTGEYGVSWLLPRLVGPAVAADLAFTARAVDADEAAALRLVNRVVPDVDAAALELARTIAANSPRASDCRSARCRPTSRSRRTTRRSSSRTAARPCSPGPPTWRKRSRRSSRSARRRSRTDDAELHRTHDRQHRRW